MLATFDIIFNLVITLNDNESGNFLNLVLTFLCPFPFLGKTNSKHNSTKITVKNKKSVEKQNIHN